MAGMVLEAHCAKKNKTKGSRKVREILHVHHVHAPRVNVHHVHIHILCILPTKVIWLESFWVRLGNPRNSFFLIARKISSKMIKMRKTRTHP